MHHEQRIINPCPKEPKHKDSLVRLSSKKDQMFLLSFTPNSTKSSHAPCRCGPPQNASGVIPRQRPCGSKFATSSFMGKNVQSQGGRRCRWVWRYVSFSVLWILEGLLELWVVLWSCLYGGPFKTIQEWQSQNHQSHLRNRGSDQTRPLPHTKQNPSRKKENKRDGETPNLEDLNRGISIDLHGIAALLVLLAKNHPLGQDKLNELLETSVSHHFIHMKSQKKSGSKSLLPKTSWAPWSSPLGDGALRLRTLLVACLNLTSLWNKRKYPGEAN